MNRNEIPPAAPDWAPLLFPAGTTGPAAAVNLEAEALALRAAHPDRLPGEGPNPMLSVEFFQSFLAGVHRRMGVAWSYGGWMEDRRFLWRGSYMEGTGGFTHLGVDFHVARGNPVGAVPGRVVLVDDDGDQDGGWGCRVFLRPDSRAIGDVVLIYAHLQNPACQPGRRTKAGEVLAEVGGPPWNGNWAPHLHVQAVAWPLFEELLRDRFQELDGYGPLPELERLKRDYPDPLPLLSAAAAAHGPAETEGGRP